MKRQSSRMKRASIDQVGSASRRGSTLVIVIALLGLLATTGTVFYIFASQQRAAAEFFSEAAKLDVDDAEDPFPWALEQLLLGPRDDQKGSILWSPTRRHSLVRNLVGSDTVPHSGAGFHVGYDDNTAPPTITGLPVIDNDFDGIGDVASGTFGLTNHINFVDAPSGWGSNLGTSVEGLINDARDLQGANAIPEPDVDYTYPDINNLFLGYRGWAVRDNGAGTPRFERIPMIIPSFFRPQYMKSALGQGANGVDVPTDPDWFNDTLHPGYAVRSFRPHAQHIAGFDGAGNPVLRYLDGTNVVHAPIIAALPGASGEFPLRPNEGTAKFNNSADYGKLGVWTGHGAVSATTFELDSDNDGDGIREGIWLDTQYPVQQATDGRLYAILHSFTIHDLDGLIDLNAHGNIAAVPRDENVLNLKAGGSNAILPTTSLSQSNQGIGPHEINPLHALAPRTATLVTDPASPFIKWYGSNPTTRLEQANMEWLWLLTGRISGVDPSGTTLLGETPVVHDGRLGDASLLWFHSKNGRAVGTLPRPGRSGKAPTATTDDLKNFGGFEGFDDNGDVLEGMSALNATGRVRGIIHPLDFSGRGSRTVPGDPRQPNMLKDLATPEQWPLYSDYPFTGDSATRYDDISYAAGRDGDITTTADNLVSEATFVSTGGKEFNNPLFEDPYETVMDPDRAIRPDDQIFGIQDLISGHLTKTDQDNAEGLSDRLRQIAPETFADNSNRSQMFTTLSNSFRHFAMALDLANRPWEASADADGDGKPEFPPQFGGVLPFSATDPFRPQVRRLLTTEFGGTQSPTGQLPLSLNHVLDVERTAQTPLEGTQEFLNFMQRSGIRFRSLTEHPVAIESVGGTTARESVTTVPTVVSGSPLPTFPPQTFEDREFWARRDRQQMARDIFVLLYTIGGAEFSGGQVRDYTGNNNDRVLYSEDKVRQMAQFAVNIVDAMDADNIITKFEYDKNLGDGWGLDDDAFTFTDTLPNVVFMSDVTKDGMYPDDLGDRGVVYGVEAQQLAFSEFLAFRSQRLAADHDATSFDDTHASSTTEENDFLFVELQNMLPTPLHLGSQLPSGETIDKTVWRLVRQDRVASTDPIQDSAEGAAAAPDRFIAFATDAAGNNVISGGGRFSISATNAVGANVVSSDFFVDIGTFDGNVPGVYAGPFDSTYELIAPNSATGTMPTTTTVTTDPAWDPRCDVDVIAHAGLGVFYQPATPFMTSISSAAGTPQPYAGHSATGPFGTTAPLALATDVEGRFDNTTPDAPTWAANNPGFDLVLQRRLNPDLPSITSLTLNPWIEVDRVRVALSDFNIVGTDTAAEIRADSGTDHLQNLQSVERGEPLRDFRSQSTLVLDTVNAFRSNTIKGDVTVPSNDSLGVNTASPIHPNGFNVWQPHWDREFASPGELLTVPVYPPSLTTQKLNFSRLSPFQQLGSSITPPTTRAAGAAALFLRPDVNPDTPHAATALDNRWYRLFQFVEVPSRVNRMLDNYINIKRLPGKLNPNTVRDREVYAGLIDDPNFIDQIPLVDSNANSEEDGPFGDSFANDGADGLPATTGRDRWLELINERDGNVLGLFDPTPGAPGSGDEIAADHWIPGTPNSRPFRSLDHRVPDATPGNDNGMEETLLRRLGLDVPQGTVNTRRNITGEGPGGFNTTLSDASNRHWLEVGDQAYHSTNITGAVPGTPTEHHQLLSKIMNNTTTVSNAFIIYGTAAYFEAHEDAATGLVQVGGRMGLDLDGDSDETNDAGWEQRAVFVVDRTEFFNAYDSASGTVDWKRLVKYRINLASDGK